MSEQPAEAQPEDPEPIKHSDAERVTAEEAAGVPVDEDDQPDAGEQRHEAA
jgi:hypothetical protein